MKPSLRLVASNDVRPPVSDDLRASLAPHFLAWRYEDDRCNRPTSEGSDSMTWAGCGPLHVSWPVQPTLVPLIEAQSPQGKDSSRGWEWTKITTKRLLRQSFRVQFLRNVAVSRMAMASTPSDPVKSGGLHPWSNQTSPWKRDMSAGIFPSRDLTPPS